MPPGGSPLLAALRQRQGYQPANLSYLPTDTPSPPVAPPPGPEAALPMAILGLQSVAPRQPNRYIPGAYVGENIHASLSGLGPSVEELLQAIYEGNQARRTTNAK